MILVQVRISEKVCTPAFFVTEMVCFGYRFLKSL